MKRVEKEVKEMTRKAGSEEYETSWDENAGVHKLKKKSNVKKGRISRAAGSRFELKVRNDLESKGRIVDKWTNNFDLEKKKVTPAKRKYNPFKKVLVIGTGFPDFISIKQIDNGIHNIIGVEVKMNGTLSKIEKEKCAWYLKEGIFSNIWIAKKGEKKGTIDYIDFKEKFGKGKKFSQFFEP